MISITSLAKTASKSWVDWLSRSRIGERNDPGRSWSANVNWRACWVTRVGGTAGQVDARAAEFGKEEHVQARKGTIFGVDGAPASCASRSEWRPAQETTKPEA